MAVAPTPAASPVQGEGAAGAHSLTAEEVLKQLGVADPRSGLDPGEVEKRRAQYGPNKLAEAKPEPGWKAFLRQYRDLMQLVLLGAAIVSIVALQDFSTGIVIIALTVAQRRPGAQPGGQGGRERRRAAEDARDPRARAARGCDRATSRPRSSCRVTSSRSRPATRSRRTAA